MATQKTIDEIFGMCIALYPLYPEERDADHVRLLRQAWNMILADVPDELLAAVATDTLRHAHKQRPVPGELYEAAMKASEQNAEQLAEKAWVHAKEALYFRDPITDPLALKTVQALGGAEVFANVETDKIHFLHDRFVKMYNSLKESEQARGGLMLENGAAIPRLTIAAKRLTEWQR